MQVQCETDENFHHITVTDTGDGIDTNVRDQVFEPFFTTKDVGRGTGLGLSLVYSLVTEHGGSVRIDDEHTNGTRMIVKLPALHDIEEQVIAQ